MVIGSQLLGNRLSSGMILHSKKWWHEGERGEEPRLAWGGEKVTDKGGDVGKEKRHSEAGGRDA